jgi:hypothetical protein
LFFVKAQPNNQEPCREEFPDGSALITYQDGSLLILESSLARTTMLREGKSVSYSEPPPPPAGEKPMLKPERCRGN